MLKKIIWTSMFLMFLVIFIYLVVIDIKYKCYLMTGFDLMFVWLIMACYYIYKYKSKQFN